MLRINFYPDNNSDCLLKAISEYRTIWDKEGLRIVEVMEKISRLRFKERFINAIVLEGTSISHPLALKASLSKMKKRGVLVHELGHRLIAPYAYLFKTTVYEERLLKTHQRLYLILYDIWSDIYGEKFAGEMVRFESDLKREYKQAWLWVLALKKEKRKELFTHSLKNTSLENDVKTFLKSRHLTAVLTTRSVTGRAGGSRNS